MSCINSQALKMYMRARDHCTSSKHIVQLCLNIIKVCKCVREGREGRERRGGRLKGSGGGRRERGVEVEGERERGGGSK